MVEPLKEFLAHLKKDLTVDQFLVENKERIHKMKDAENFRTELQINKALSNEIRLMIYKLIKIETICNCALAKIFDLSKGAITHHLKILEKANLIVGRNNGHFTYYFTTENLKREL